MRKRNQGVAKQIILLCTPFLLFAIATCLLAITFFSAVIAPSGIWRAFTAAELPDEKNEVIDDVLEMIEPEVKQISTAEDVVQFYSMDDFPAIVWGKKWALLSVPYLGEEGASVYNGNSMTVLSAGIGHDLNSCFPGQGGNCVLMFHVNRQKYLYYLQDIPIGEKVIMKTSYGTYVYQVFQKSLFGNSDRTFLHATEEERLTIYTCYPKEGPYRKERIAILCSLVPESSDPLWR